MKSKPSSHQAPADWETHPLDWSRTEGHAERLLGLLELRQKRQRQRHRAATGAAAALLLIAAVIWFPRASTPVRDQAPVAASRAIITAPERRLLPDGSTVELKPGAEIAVDYTAGTRAVTLATGEALFSVAKDAARPFVVTAGGMQFRAVGTAFTVDLRSGSIAMLVTEGRVVVEPTGSHGSGSAVPLAEVDAGHRVELAIAQATAPAVIPSSTAETAERLAWRVPRLEFNETPLQEVVSLLNRHSGARITLATDPLGRVEISGALRADNIEPLFQILESDYNIHVVRAADGAIELRQER